MRTLYAWKSFPSLFTLHTQSLTSSLGCKDLCVIMRFLVLWSMRWSTSLLHFINGLKLFTRWTAQIFIPFKIFLLYNLVSSSYLVLVRHSFIIFLSYLLVWWCPIPIFPSIYKFLSPEWSDFFLHLVVQFFRHFWFSSFPNYHGTFLRQNPSQLCYSVSLWLILVFPLFLLFSQVVSCRPLCSCFFFFSQFMKFVPACEFPKYMYQW